MNRILLLLSLTFISNLWIQGQTTNSASGEKTGEHLIVLKNGTVFTGESSDEPAIRDIYIRHDTIAAIVSSREPAPIEFAEARTYDLGGKHVLPGLVDAHVHLIPFEGKMIEEIQENLRELLKKELMAGVTTLRDMGGDGLLLGTFARSANAGKIPSPDIFYSAFFAGQEYYNLLSQRSQGSTEYIPGENLPWRQTVNNTFNVEAAMARAKASGATGIKLYNDMSSDMLKKLSEEAKRQGLRVWSHATINPPLPSDAVEAGVEVISHAYLILYEQMKGKNKPFDFDYYTSRSLERDFNGLNQLFDAMKRNNTILDATIFLNLQSGEESPDWKNAVHVVTQAHARGVKVCVGTDWMFNEEENRCNIVDEISLFVERCGFSPREAIIAATQISAEAIGLSDRGILAPGKRADMVVLDKDPFSDIRNLQYVNKVIKQGVIYPSRPTDEE